MKLQYTLYDYLPSGNGYKVRLTAKYLDIPHHLLDPDITPRRPEA
jgi:glutathione S-transferase